MSNPIGEAAGYFEKKKEHSYVQDTSPSVVIPPQQSPASSSMDPWSPPSPETRRKPLDQQQQDSNFDPRAQWQRMLKKISLNDTSDTNSHRSRLPHLNDDSNTNSDDSDNITDSDSNSEGGRHVEKSIMEPRFGKPRKYQQHDDDATLPTPRELEDAATTTNDSNNSSASVGGDNSNYFAHPFSPDKTPLPTTSQSEIPTGRPWPSSASSQAQQQDNSVSPSAPDDHNQDNDLDKQARNQWGKTLDKVRLIANIQKPHIISQHLDTDASTSLAPYCSALFDPPFVALSKDSHGRRPVSRKNHISTTTVWLTMQDVLS